MSSTLDVLEEFLLKARRRLSDEEADYFEQEEPGEDEGLSQVDENDLDAPPSDETVTRTPRKRERAVRELNFDDGSIFDDENEEPSEEEDDASGDAADDWLRANDPKAASKKPARQAASKKPAREPVAAPPPRQPVTPTAPVPSEVRSAPAPVTRPSPTPAASQTQPASPEVARQPKRVVMPAPASATSDPRESNDMQPTREELAQLREYTRAFSARARDKARLEAEAHKNPGRHYEGRIIEARKLSHADYQRDYDEFTRSPEFQNADPFTQMEMETQFKSDWHQKNPEHRLNALNAHATAHQKGIQAKGLFEQAKDEKIRHIAGGGVNPDAMSVEEGLQHAGFSREEDDSTPGGIVQDKSASFAASNKEFVDQFMREYNEKRGKKPISSVDPYAHADEQEQRPDVASLIGSAPQFKDAAQKRAHDMIVQRYYPLIEKAKRRTLNAMGLTEAAKSGSIDDGALHEAGLHALYEAINDYDHNHPSKASFTTHLNRKMTGLMQTALKAQDEIPTQLRAGAAKFRAQQQKSPSMPSAAPSETPATPPPTPAPPQPPPPPKVAVAPKKRTAAEIASAHPPHVQDRLKRLAALKPKSTTATTYMGSSGRPESLSIDTGSNIEDEDE